MSRPLPDKRPRRVTVAEDAWVDQQSFGHRVRALTGLPEGASHEEVIERLRAMLRAGVETTPASPVRRRLPDERRSVVRKMHLPPSPPKPHTCPKCGHVFEVQRPPLKVYVTAGFYEDGSVGEFFIRADRAGSFVSGILDGLAIASSLALQHGTPPLALARQFAATKFDPAGVTGDPRFPMVSSFLDYFGRWLRELVSPSAGPDPAGEGDLP